MTTQATDDLISALADLRRHFPDWRIGQMIANLVQAAGCDGEGAIWDIEDEQLLTAARRLIERDSDRIVANVGA